MTEPSDAAEDQEEPAWDRLTKFEDALKSIESAVDPVMKLARDENSMQEMSQVDRARTHIALAYAANTLFYMYLRSKGVDPSEHPVREELVRVKDAYVKLVKVLPAGSDENKPAASNSKLNMEAGSRFLAASVDASAEDKARIRKVGKEVEKRKGAAKNAKKERKRKRKAESSNG